MKTTQTPTWRGKRKGGTQFPQIPLKKAVEYAGKLVARTHIEPQPDTIILKGVFGAAGSDGQVRASALKQYDLLSGPASAYTATDLARQINAAPEGEVQPLLQRAVLHPRLFKSLYDTYQNDTVSRAKIKQQAAQLKVHPESVDKAVGIFVESIVYAGLAAESGQDVQIGQVVRADRGDKSAAEQRGSDESESGLDTAVTTDEHERASDNPPPLPPAAAAGESNVDRGVISAGVRSQMNVNLSLDSTMDPEKLEKSLTLLRRYGVI